MKTWGAIGSTLILGLYYIDKSKNVEKFTQTFNEYFHTDVSAQTIHFELAVIKNSDPANNMGQNTADPEYAKLWEYYILQERIDVLKGIYRSFKKRAFVEVLDISDETECIPEDYILKHGSQQITDVPEPCPPDYKSKGLSAYKRRHEVVANVLSAANYKCEANCTCELFLRKDRIHTYTEAHHLIPLCYQSSFQNSLDVEANVISLCPHCHRLLHYGADNQAVLKQLYQQRRHRLSKCGLDISFEDLLLMYR